jgi:Kdo2-lipid IVA lauroyltransferase/acyltransferase
MAQTEVPTWRERAQFLAIRLLIAVLLALPYRWRVPLAGWGFSRIAAPLTRAPAMIRRNLARTLPDLPEADVRQLCRTVPANVGRTMAELISGREFLAHVADTPIRGEGLAAVEAARAAGRGVILVSGHFGNYDVPRAVFAGRGWPVGGLYQPPKNPAIHARYHQIISDIGQPVFPRGRKGLAGLVKHLRAGGAAGILIDWHMDHGAELNFFGRPAQTALSAAELALKYDCLLVPAYGLRQPDGLHFELILEAPIRPGTPVEMTQALNDSLEAITRQHLDQWFWVQRRWKQDDRKRFARRRRR